MRIVRLAAMAFLVGGSPSIAAYGAFLGPANLNAPASFETIDALVLVQSKQKESPTRKSNKKGHNYNSGPNSSLGFIPGYVPTPYGRGDCIGWWEPLGNGLMRCHGQFIREHQ
jgi:hypothetical protein